MKTPWEKDKMNFDKLQIASGDKKEGEKVDPFVFDELGQMPKFNEVGHVVSIPRFYQFPKVNDLIYKINTYPDMSQYITIGGGNNLTFRINHYGDLWTLNQINDVLLHEGRTCFLFIPNILDGQADRRFNDNESSGLKLVCQFLNGLKAFHTIEVFHPHNGEVVEALIDRVKIIDSSEFINRVLNWSSDTFVEGEINHIDMNNLVFLLPDGGAYKWGVKVLDKVLKSPKDIVAAAKNRQYIEGHSKLVQQLPDYDFEGKDVMIIDDICIGGGTFKGLSKLLKEKNCGKLYLAVSHLTVNDLGNDPVTNYFDKVFTTNSKFDADRYISWDHDIHKQLVVIDLF